MGFNSPEGDLSEIFITNTDLIQLISAYLYGWGNGTMLGDYSTSSVPVMVFNIIENDILHFPLTFGHHVGFVNNQNQLYTWGANNAGQLGDNSRTAKSIPTQIQGDNWASVETSSAIGITSGHTSAIKTDGTLWLWGHNASGQLGTNNTINRSSPVQITGGGTNWRKTSNGLSHVLALKTDGTLWSWGNNTYGQLGHNNITHRSSPVQITGGGTNWNIIASGLDHSLAIKTDETLWAWGDNTFGQLGVGNRTHRSSPTQIVGNWTLVSTNGDHTLAIKTDGTLWSWGLNTYGQLGDGTRTHRSSPVQTVSGGTNWKSVSVGLYYTSAIKTDGTLWSWGLNLSGQLGTNDTTNRSSPVQTVSGGTNWIRVSTGTNDATFATGKI